MRKKQPKVGTIEYMRERWCKVDDRHPLEIARDERAKTDPCQHCGFHNQDPNFKGTRFYTSNCKSCGKGLCHSYLFAPWSLTWEYIQKMQDRFEDKYGIK